MEELRHIIDRIVLAMIHCREITEDDFSRDEQKSGRECRMEKAGFRKFIHRYETTMASQFTTSDDEKMSYNSYLDEMANRLKRALRLQIPYRALRIY